MDSPDMLAGVTKHTSVSSPFRYCRTASVPVTPVTSLMAISTSFVRVSKGVVRMGALIGAPWGGASALNKQSFIGVDR